MYNNSVDLHTLPQILTLTCGTTPHRTSQPTTNNKSDNIKKQTKPTNPINYTTLGSFHFLIHATIKNL